MTATINTSATPEARAAAVSTLRSQGDRYGHAAIAGLAHELAVRLEGDKLPNGVATKLVDSTGYDKGTVSRVGKIVRTNKDARKAAIKFDVMHAADTETTFDAAVKVGLIFKRQPAKPPTTRTKSEPDPIADLYTWLIESTDDQYEPRKALVADVLARIDGERAALAASESEQAAA